ncbi:MAG: [Fe-Fe] hydrogenase large subunit C-terminal domain-containing protein, partial [Clostridiales bacterium]
MPVAVLSIVLIVNARQPAQPPSFVANYNGLDIAVLEKALQKLGFAAAEETAIGATIVKQEYENLLKSGQRNILISSCCHSVNLLIQKHHPGCLKYLADIISPMQAHSLQIKKRYPNAKTVFIGPCVAKKDEAEHYQGIVDAVLTFEDLTNWLKAENIPITTEEKNPLEIQAESKARFFPITGGILKSMDCNQEGYTYLAIDGIENCIAALEDIERGNLHNCFIEMSACIGSCIGGPVMEKYHRSPIHDYLEVSRYAGNKDFKVDNLPAENMLKSLTYISKSNIMPSQSEIKAILKKMAKNKPEDELNCGCCGYNTCRQKAVAIYQGKADLSMCLPFLKEKAESFSDNIINNTPNGIIVLDEDLQVQQINKAALNIMNIPNQSDVLGDQVIRILDPKDFMY